MIQDAKLMAQSLISRYTTNNPFEIADALDYIVLFVPLCGIRGFHQYIKRNHIIYIDDSLSEEDQRWVYPADVLAEEYDGCTTAQIAEILGLPLPLIEYAAK